jgi:N-acyl amino acid synthase of PEP-CTERM/exosortase system
MQEGHMFDNFYDVLIADDEYTRSQHHSVRYQVYCLETGYENAAQFPQNQEVDVYDAQSLPFIVNSKRNGDSVASMRLILNGCRQLPTLQAFPHVADLLFSNSSNVVAEVSRLGVIGDYRRATPIQRGEAAHPKAAISLADRRKEPAIMIGLLRAAYWYSRVNGISHWAFMAAPSLIRLLRNLGFEIQQVGPVVEFKGMRAPHVCDMETFAAKLAVKSPQLQRMFTSGTFYSFASELSKAQAIA